MPNWSEGIVLPNFASQESQSRTLYAIRDTTDKKYTPLLNATTALIKGWKKLMGGFGREGERSGEFIRLYDLENDPEELNDLSASKPALAAELLHELKQKLDEVNAPYE
jgi:arylsulfatase A-like enzyme